MVSPQELIRKQQEAAARRQRELQSRMLKQKAVQVHPHSGRSKAGMIIFILIIIAILAVYLFIYQPWKYFFK